MEGVKNQTTIHMVIPQISGPLKIWSFFQKNNKKIKIGALYTVRTDQRTVPGGGVFKAYNPCHIKRMLIMEIIYA
jgi:hypothetical protein